MRGINGDGGVERERKYVDFDELKAARNEYVFI